VIRVAILVEQNWNTVPGGTARSINRLVEELQRDATVELVGVHGRHSTEPVLAVPSGLATVELPVPGRALTQIWNRMDRPRMERWTGPIDVVHAPAYLVPGTTNPAVVTVHDLAFRHNPSWFTPHGVRYFDRFLERLAAADHRVIVPSARTATDCAQHGIDPDRIDVIPWGSEAIDVTDQQVADTLERHGVRDDAVLFVGTIEPRKNLDGLLAAMRLLPERQLVLVGPSGWGNTELGDALVLGSLERAEVAALMAGCGVVAYPSHFEGFGLPVLEAMAQGTPVIVTTGTVPEELAADAGVAVDTTNPRSLAAAIEQVLADAPYRERVGALGRQRAAEFDWATTAARTTEVYRKLAR
jgi:glycosyltransferase involved in cell wall biosynthesis